MHSNIVFEAQFYYFLISLAHPSGVWKLTEVID